jgi:hypothetical protein
VISTARAKLLELLTTDPEFVADMMALKLGSKGEAVVPRTIKGNKPFAQLQQRDYPCWVTDRGNSGGASGSEYGDPDGLVLNSTQQDWRTDIGLALVWHQQDFGVSLDQRDGIHPALVRLLLRNPDLQDTCSLAWVVGELSDRQATAPTHAIAFEIRVQHTIYRDSP